MTKKQFISKNLKIFSDWDLEYQIKYLGYYLIASTLFGDIYVDEPAMMYELRKRKLQKLNEQEEN